jgi:hypothetical protein
LVECKLPKLDAAGSSPVARSIILRPVFNCQSMKMTRIVLIIAALIVVSTGAYGAPFLVSDPYPRQDKGLTKFLVTINGETTESAPSKNTDGTLYLKYDLGNLPDGTYTATIKAVNAKGQESSPATYSFKKTGGKVEPYTPPVQKQKIQPSRSYPGHSIK